MFEKYNLKVTGWEEIVLNKDSANNIAINPKFVGKNILPLVWDNTGDNIDLGYRIANAGYPVVLCNVTNLYFDLAYNTDPSEPGLYWGGFQDAIDPYVMTPFDVYKSANFDMFGRFSEKEESFSGKERLKPEARKNIVGLQAQLWSETLKGPKMMEYYTVPKLFAFAEKAWAAAPAWENETDISKRVAGTWKGWGELSNRIGQNELERIDRLFGNYNYRIAAPGAVIEEGMLKANSAFPGLIIRYTTDGSEPDGNSTEYKEPVKVDGKVNVRAFNKAGRGSKTFVVN
jgi:hexosaminidase